MKPVLDACCGGRMFWFRKDDPRAVFVDVRRGSHVLADRTAKTGERTFAVSPDFVADFTSLPFSNNTFSLVVFDPPHLDSASPSGWLARKYGTLQGKDWRDMLRRGFAECFRVLRSEGTLIFKWNETDIPVSEILKLTPEQPLFGHRSGRQNKTHWVAFLKSESGVRDE